MGITAEPEHGKDSGWCGCSATKDHRWNICSVKICYAKGKKGGWSNETVVNYTEDGKRILNFIWMHKKTDYIEEQWWDN